MREAKQALIVSSWMCSARALYREVSQLGPLHKCSFSKQNSIWYFCFLRIRSLFLCKVSSWGSLLNLYYWWHLTTIDSRASLSHHRQMVAVGGCIAVKLVRYSIARVCVYALPPGDRDMASWQNYSLWSLYFLLLSSSHYYLLLYLHSIGFYFSVRENRIRQLGCAISSYRASFLSTWSSSSPLTIRPVIIPRKPKKDHSPIALALRTFVTARLSCWSKSR